MDWPQQPLTPHKSMLNLQLDMSLFKNDIENVVESTKEKEN